MECVSEKTFPIHSLHPILNDRECEAMKNVGCSETGDTKKFLSLHFPFGDR